MSINNNKEKSIIHPFIEKFVDINVIHVCKNTSLYETLFLFGELVAKDKNYPTLECQRQKLINSLINQPRPPIKDLGWYCYLGIWYPCRFVMVTIEEAEKYVWPIINETYDILQEFKDKGWDDYIPVASSVNKWHYPKPVQGVFCLRWEANQDNVKLDYLDFLMSYINKTHNLNKRKSTSRTKCAICKKSTAYCCSCGKGICGVTSIRCIRHHRKLVADEYDCLTSECIPASVME